MAGKSSDGFTKAAQSHKFVRHRDVKMKDSELRREAHIQKAMSEGICDKCRDKVQWRFKYDKYKPLSRPATCQACKNKTVHKAYRSMCDPCAVKKDVCPACCINIEQSNIELKRARELNGRKTSAAGEGEGNAEGDEEENEDDFEEDDEAEMSELRKKFIKPSELSSVHMEVEKSERELAKMAATKYNKSRLTGTTEDSIFSSLIGEVQERGDEDNVLDT
jgi:Uncharacterized conserved protein (DUF2039)